MYYSWYNHTNWHFDHGKDKTGKKPDPAPLPDIRLYTHDAEWQIYDSAGREIERDSKPFESEAKANEFAQRLKASISTEKNIILIIRKLDSNQIIRRFKKKSGKKNYRRG